MHGNTLVLSYILEVSFSEIKAFIVGHWGKMVQGLPGGQTIHDNVVSATDH